MRHHDLQIEQIHKELCADFNCPRPEVSKNRKETLLFWSKDHEYLELALETQDVILWFYRNSSTGACEGGSGHQDALFMTRLKNMFYDA